MENITIIASLIAMTTVGNTAGNAPAKVLEENLATKSQVTTIEQKAEMILNQAPKYKLATDAEIEHCNK
jgi:hypothetical protein